jgi:hypothetical protein
MARSASKARGSDAASLKSESTTKALETPGEQHCLVDSDDEGLLTAEELEWALAQRSTDPFIKQRLQKGKFMVSKKIEMKREMNLAACNSTHTPACLKRHNKLQTGGDDAVLLLLLLLLRPAMACCSL